MIPHNRLNFSKNDKSSILSPLNRGYITEGKETKELENYLVQFLDKKFCAAVSSGYMALVLALEGLNVNSGDEVIMPSYTCTALWQAIKFVEATPQIVDIEEETYNLDPQKLDEKVSEQTAAIIFPHMFGQPGNILAVKNTFDIPIIEDIAQTIGSKLDTHQAGSIGDITVCSFYGTKMIGAGEGGAVLTDSSKIHHKIEDLKSYDEKSDLKKRYNAKMSDIISALTLNRLQNIEENILERKNIFSRYLMNFEELIQIPVKSSQYSSNYFRCIASHPDYTANEIIEAGRKNSIQFRKPVFKPIHLYSNYNLKLPVSEKAWENQFSIPIYPDLKQNEIQQIINFLTRL